MDYIGSAFNVSYRKTVKCYGYVPEQSSHCKVML